MRNMFLRKKIALAFLFLFLSLAAGQSVYAQTLKEWNPKRTWVFFAGLLEWEDAERFASFPQINRRDAVLLDVLRERGVPENQIVYLKDREATREKIQKNLETVLQQAQPGDWVFIYYCGHGYKNKRHETFLAAYDAKEGNDWAVASVPATIEKFFKGSSAVIMLDNCYSGAMAEAVKKYQNSKISYLVLASAHFNSFSTANWTFTESLIYAFRGEPFIDDDRNGRITLRELEENSADDMLFAEQQIAQFARTGDFDGQTVIASAKRKPAPREGERIEAYDSGWYKAIITDATGGKYKVHYFGYEYGEDAFRSETELRAVAPKTVAIGSKVEAEWKGRWYPARILNVKGGAHLVSYENFGSEWDEWISSDRVRCCLK